MIAQTILMQLGGRRFVAFTGSRQLTDMGNGLRMNLARNKTSANRLDIIYDGGTDLYNLRFYRKTFSKRPLMSRLRTLPSMKVSILICSKVYLQRLRDYAPTSEHRADFPPATFFR